MNFLSIDVGSTCCKCQVFSSSGEIVFYGLKEYSLKKIDNDFYVDTKALTEILFLLIKDAGKENDIDSICISSFGESFVMLDKDDNVLFNPMMYTDTRGETQAEEIISKFSKEYMFRVTGVLPHSMYSLSKILWIKENAPDTFARANKILLICDYVGYVLTGKRVIDYSLAARTGAFDIRKKEY
ncbi:MAG: carbohydrate kinase, partial [Clostridiales bacterium]|nr:carbohydrate kinase [Clostridiales bacterium]